LDRETIKNINRFEKDIEGKDNRIFLEVQQYLLVKPLSAEKSVQNAELIDDWNFNIEPFEKK